MTVLIAESNIELGQLWQRHLMRQGLLVSLVHDEAAAIAHLDEHAPTLIVLDLMLNGNAAFAVADYASFRHPDARVIFVTNSTFFSDGSIFQHLSNACAFLPKEVDPGDLSAIASHYVEKD
ncbi:response regulator [Celeribacter arenosi]|uniref:Response regulator n=1 Tax=Celeribacter arenosi TaxID=792649 RepID=A0ABP7K116_9RHOB